MREIRTSGLMSGDGKQGDAEWPKPLRPSSTLPAEYMPLSQKSRRQLEALFLLSIVYEMVPSIIFADTDVLGDVRIYSQISV